jgi:PAS domain S-box-containing protein
MKIVRALNLEHAEAESLRVRAELEKGFDVEWRRAADLGEFRSCLRTSEWDLIISAYRLPDSNGLEAFETAVDEGVDVPFIIVSGSIDQESAVAAMRLGVSDYLKKDDLTRLVPAVTRSLLEAADRREMRSAEKALAESEDRLRLALRAAGIGAWEWDLTTNDAVWSPEASAIIGVTVAGSSGSALIDIVNANDLEVLKSAAASAIVSRRSFDAKVRIRRRRGGDRWVAVSGKCEFDRGDVPQRLVGTIRDITHDKQAQDALAEAEARYKIVSSMATDYMFAAHLAIDGALSMEWIAGALEPITGRGEDFFNSGGTWRSIVHPDDFYLEEADERAVLEGHQVDSELRIVKPNGETVWVRRLAKPVWDKDAGRVVGIVGAVKDVTERKSAELAVREREEYLRTVLNAEPQCVKTFGPDGVLLDINPAGLAMLEADSESQVLGRDIFAVVRSEYAAQVEDAVRRAFEGETVTVSYQMKAFKGTERRMEMCATPIRNTEGMITAVLGVSIDITEKHRMEAALVESERQYSDLINSVEGIVWEVEIPTMHFTFVSRQAETILGFPVERWYEDDFWVDHIHPEDRDHALNYCAQETARGEGHTFEYRMIAADGRIVWLRDIVSVVVEGGKAVKLRGLMVDVTEQRRMDAAMKQQALLIEQSNEAIFVWDLNEGVLEWNRGCETLYGYTRDEMLGKFASEVLRTKFAGSVDECRQKLITQGTWTGEVTQTTAAGEEVIADSRAQLIELDGRKVVLQSSRDMTEMRRAEAGRSRG